jgi:ESS family glutamate:Na+ symporter
MIGGLLLQLFFSKTKVTNLIDHGLMQRISGTALDFLVVAAVSTIKLQLILDNFMPFILLVTAGILWNIFCVLWLSRRILPNYWFERSVAEMGQSMGVTATGLLLLRTVDPEAETAPAAFGYKQLLHEPFMGGGLWTSLAVPLAITRGGWPVLLISMGAIVIWLLICKLLWGRGRNMFKAQ